MVTNTKRLVHLVTVSPCHVSEEADVMIDDIPFPVPGHAGAVLTVDLGAIAANWREQQRRVGTAVECAAVIKGDAFGCGIEQVAPALRKGGCRCFFVATPSEAFRLQA